MKKILFDLTATQPFGANKRHGGGKYGEVILRRMLQKNVPIVCYYDSKRWINPDITAALKSNKVELFDISKFTLTEIVQQSKCDKIYSALPQLSLFSFNECKVICTIHGLRRLETPADPFCFLYRNNSWKSIIAFFFQWLFPTLYKKTLCKYKLREWGNQMVQFVTVSNHSACSIKTYFPGLKDKEIPVFYSPSTSSDREIKEKYHDKYFLMVSGNRSEKNNLRAIKALDMLFSRGCLDGYKVKITGASSADIYRYKIRNRDCFDFLGFVDEDELDQLYHDAYSLIYPSLNEGFGYPPLEAMHFGTPVIASPYTSIPEVCEGAAIYFNPFSIEEIAARILYIINPGVREEYSKRSKLQYKKVTSKQNDDLDSLIDYIVNN